MDILNAILNGNIYNFHKMYCEMECVMKRSAFIYFNHFTE